MAQNTGDNVREIEGFIARLKAERGLETDSRIFPKKEAKIKPSPQEVLNEVSSFYGIDIKKLLKKTRNRKISLVRQIAIYLVRQVCKEPLTAIGKLFGVSDHTSVLYAIRRIEKLKAEDKKLEREIEFLKTKLLDG